MSDTTIAVLSDIHGNRWALAAVIADITRRGIERIFNLGDNLYGPLDPIGCAEQLLALDLPGIRGNQDRILIVPPPNHSPLVADIIARLEPRHLNWLCAQPPTVILSEGIFLCHGTPQHDDLYLTEEVTEHGVRLRASEQILALLTGVTQEVLLCGHSHIPRALYLPNGMLVVNPGSVGLPAYDDDLPLPHVMVSGSPHAKYAILRRTAGQWTVEQVLLPYDWQAAAAAAAAYGRNDWARWIASGWA